MAELRKISPEQLRKILAEHKKCVESEGKEGTQVNLSKANLTGVELLYAPWGQKL